jgi:hypothetical protein
MNTVPFYPFDAQRLIGTVSEVGPSYLKVNLPRAADPEGHLLHGFRVGSGEVGEFVVVEVGDLAVFGRITLVRLPERERLSVEPQLGRSPETHPVGTVQLLTTVDVPTGVVDGGVTRYPRLGARVFSAHPDFLRWLTESADVKRLDESRRTLTIASIPDAANTVVSLSPEILFGRHCAILGATGGGKSWTVAQFVEQLSRWSAKVILLDATGEFFKLGNRVKHVFVGSGGDQADGATEVSVPYRNLVEHDLFALFTPSGQSQAPKLRSAIRSLKLAEIAPELATDGLILKANQQKKKFDDAYRKHVKGVDSPGVHFDITKLAQQIDCECVWATATNNDASRWGGPHDGERSWCTSLMMRIDGMLTASDLACIFDPIGKSLFDTIAEFMVEQNNAVLRVSLKNVGFGYAAREIAANAIGRHLLSLARSGAFKNRPLLVVLDEAHQFLNKALGDESNRYALDSFELIAKEGRKHGLTICLATQRPRDIPEGVLSQMGVLVVHRLTNDRDREVVERASGEIDRSAAAFLPTLAPGRAAIIGVDFPIPLTIQILAPKETPESAGPNYQKNWA